MKTRIILFLITVIFIIFSIMPVSSASWIINNDTTSGFTSANINLNGSSWTGQNGGGLELNKNSSYINGLIASYDFDEISGTSIHNVNTEFGVINSTNEGTWNGYTSINSTVGKIGNAITLDGVDDYVSIPNWDSIGWEVPGGFTNTGLAYDITDDTLWIGDFDNSQIVHTYKNGTYISSFNVGCNPGAGLQGVTFNVLNNTLMYSCFDTYKVGEVTKTGTEIKSYLVGSTNNVNHIALNNNSTVLYVVRNAANITKHWSSNGTQFGYFNITGYTGFDGISYDLSDDTIWLTKDPATIIHADLFGNVLSVFTLSFNSLEGITSNTTDGTLFLGSDALYHESIAHGNRVYNISKTANVLNVNSQFTKNITISAWIKPTNVSNVNKGLVAKRTGTANSWQLILGSASKPSFRVYNSTTFQEVVANYPATNTSLWYHLVATYNGSRILVYINGVQNNSGNFFGGNINYSSSIIQIGAFFSATGNNFNGSIDDVRVWNRTLSSSEIAVLYNTSRRNNAMPIISNQAANIGSDINRLRITFTGQDNFNNITLKSRESGTIEWNTTQSNISNNTWIDIPSNIRFNTMDFALDINGNGSNTIFLISMEIDQTVTNAVQTTFRSVCASNSNTYGTILQIFSLGIMILAFGFVFLQIKGASEGEAQVNPASIVVAILVGIVGFAMLILGNYLIYAIMSVTGC